MALGLRRFNRRFGGFPRFFAENIAILLLSSSLTSLAIALVGYAVGAIPADGHTIQELVIGGLAAPLFLLIGPGVIIALALICVVGFRQEGFSRGAVVALAVGAGLLWLVVFLLPQLLEGRGITLPQLFALVPWFVFGLVMRNRRIGNQPR